MSVTITEIAELGRQIAGAIRREGHYQGGYEDDSDIVGCCVVANPHYPYGVQSRELRLGFLEAVRRKARLGTPTGETSSDDVINWNDGTPTDQVLQVLEHLDD